VSDELKSAPSVAVIDLSGELWMGACIVLVAVAMIVQAIFFTGDRLSTTTEAINRLW
jgi:hypothetical protein